MPTYKEAFNAKTAKGEAARKKYGGNLEAFTKDAKAYNAEQAAAKAKNEAKASVDQDISQARHGAGTYYTADSGQDIKGMRASDKKSYESGYSGKRGIGGSSAVGGAVFKKGGKAAVFDTEGYVQRLSTVNLSEKPNMKLRKDASITKQNSDMQTAFNNMMGSKHGIASKSEAPELAAPTTQMEEHAAQMKQSQVDKDRHAKLTKLAGGYTDVNVIPKERSQETKDAYNTQIKKVATDTRQNQALLQTTKDLDAGKLKNIKRGKYTENIYDSNKTKYGDSRDTITQRDASGNITEYGKYNKGNFTKWSEKNKGNLDDAVSGTSTTQKGMKGSSEMYSFQQDIPDAAPRNKAQQQVDAKVKMEPGDYRYDELVLGKTPKLTGKQKRQAKRKTNKAARLKKQGERTDAKIMKNNPEFKGLSY